MRERVKTARGRKPLTRWPERQLNDPYVAAAKKDGYRSRAAYKIIEMDNRFKFFKPGGCAIDLGKAPRVAGRSRPKDWARKRIRDLSPPLIFKIWS